MRNSVQISRGILIRIPHRYVSELLELFLLNFETNFPKLTSKSPIPSSPSAMGIGEVSPNLWKILFEFYEIYYFWIALGILFKCWKYWEEFSPSSMLKSLQIPCRILSKFQNKLPLNFKRNSFQIWRDIFY